MLSTYLLTGFSYLFWSAAGLNSTCMDHWWCHCFPAQQVNIDQKKVMRCVMTYSRENEPLTSALIVPCFNSLGVKRRTHFSARLQHKSWLLWLYQYEYRALPIARTPPNYEWTSQVRQWMSCSIIKTFLESVCVVHIPNAHSRLSCYSREICYFESTCRHWEMRSDANSVAAGIKHFSTVTFFCVDAKRDERRKKSTSKCHRRYRPTAKSAELLWWRHLVAGPCEAVGLLSWGRDLSSARPSHRASQCWRSAH